MILSPFRWVVLLYNLRLAKAWENNKGMREAYNKAFEYWRGANVEAALLFRDIDAILATEKGEVSVSGEAVSVAASGAIGVSGEGARATPARAPSPKRHSGGSWPTRCTNIRVKRPWGTLWLVLAVENNKANGKGR